MSVVTLQDKTNALLRRRELVCIFRGQAGKLRRAEAAKMLSEELKLEKKVVIPVALKCETGKADLKGTFYVYDDEALAKQHLPTYIFDRLMGKKKEKKGEAPARAKAPEPKPAEEKKPKAGEEKKAEAKAPEPKPAEEKKEAGEAKTEEGAAKKKKAKEAKE